MKLFTRYNRINLLANILVLLAGSIFFYLILHYVLLRQLDETLRVEEAEILDFVKNKDSLPPPANYKDQHVNFVIADHAVKRHFSSVDSYDKLKKEEETYRLLQFPVSIHNQTYLATVSKSQAETEDLIFLIVLITVGIIVLLLFIQLIINRLLLKKLWQPFYNTLQSIKQFNLSSRKRIASNNGHIDEFSDLNNAVTQMTDKIINDYETLKDFTDNASHEMQTPLAIINSKLDLMIQDQNLDEKQMLQLQAMYDAVGRLSKLNQSLLLLTKIENNQFLSAEQINLKCLTEEKLTQLEELISVKKILVVTRLEPCILSMNEYLADILLNNLLVNAVRHNIENGKIEINLNKEGLSISNSGTELPFGAPLLFDRFKKNASSEGTGLGLAIVKQICDNYGFVITYSHSGGLHHFNIRF
jgi:signal transduction histidine kinase